MAARCGHTEIVKWLLSQKQVSGNEKDHTQYTAAHEAAEHGHVKILKFLFDHGVNVDAPDINGNTPLDIAMRMRRRACENFLKAAVAARPNGVRRPVVRKESTNNSHLDDLDSVELSSWQAQLRGKKTWTLAPPPECESTCSPFNVTVNTGDMIVINTNIWYHGTYIHPGSMSVTIGSEFD